MNPATYPLRLPGCEPLFVSSIAEAFHHVARQLGGRTAVRFKRGGTWEALSWSQFLADVEACAAVLLASGVEPGQHVGILSENRVEWLIADLAILSMGAVTVPVHAALPAATVVEQLAHAEVSWLFVSAEQVAKVEGMTGLRRLAVFDPPHPPPPSPTGGRGGAHIWKRWLNRQGRSNVEHPLSPCGRGGRGVRGQLATILYTSGTTTAPKGVMLTHSNLLSNALATLSVLPFASGGSVFNWLPLSHVYARTCDSFMSILSGTTLALAESPDTAAEDLRTVRPTNMHGVPRFYEKLLNSELGTRNSELTDVFGSNVDWLKAGGALLPPRIAEAYADAGLTLLQGYGMTECAPVIATARKGDHRPGTVGRPIPGIQTRIADDGELLVRGPNTTPGYWKDPAATADLLRDGWLHTGDLARFESDEHLVILGRKTDQIVLSTGKKVEPAPIEALLNADPFIDQAVVCGDGKPYLTALIALRDGASARELAGRVKVALAGLAPWEKVKRFALLPRPLSVAEGELTVSLKLRRAVVLERYRVLIEGIYCGG
jgi:long-chain acyl-CoA synthetase